MRRSPAAWACNGCARSWRITPSAGSIPKAYAAVVDRLKMLRERNQGLIEEIESALTQQARGGQGQGRRRRPREEALRHLEQDGAQADLARAALRHLRLPHRRSTRWTIATARSPWCTPPGTRCPAASRTTSRARSRTTISRSTPRSSARAISASSCRSAPSACTRSPNTAWRRMRSTRTANGAGAASACVPSPGQQRLSLAPPSGRHAARRRQPGGVPGAHQARAVPGPGVLLHAEGPADRAAARRQPDRLRLCGAHRHRQHLRRLPRSTAGRCRSSPSSETAMRSRSSPPTCRRRRRPGKASPSPARRARPSGAPRATPCAPNTASSAARSWSAPSSAAARPSAKTRSRSGACAPVAEDDRGRASPRSDAASLLRPMCSRAVFPEETPARPPKRRRKVKRTDEGWFGLGKVMGLKFRWPGPAARAKKQQTSGAERHPDQGLARRPAGELRRWRRGSRRSHRRHSQSGAGHHHLSDPCRGAEGLRRGARALDRRHLGHRRRQRRSASRRRSR